MAPAGSVTAARRRYREDTLVLETDYAPQAFSHVGLINTARNLSKANGPAEHRQRA